MCPPHRKITLLAKSFLDQIEDDKKRADRNLDLMGRLQKITQKSERVFVIDKQTMDDLKGLLTDQKAQIERMEDDRAAVRSSQKDPETPAT
jgi:rubrerythrin